MYSRARLLVAGLSCRLERKRCLRCRHLACRHLGVYNYMADGSDDSRWNFPAMHEACSLCVIDRPDSTNSLSYLTMNESQVPFESRHSVSQGSHFSESWTMSDDGQNHGEEGV